MSYRQKQSEMSYRKIGGLTEKSVPGQNNPSNIVSTNSDKSIVPMGASYGLRSLDKQMATNILETIPQLDPKSFRKLRQVAVSKRFINFEALVEKDPSLALKIMEEKLPELMKTAPFNSLIVAPVAPVDKAAPVDKTAPVAPALRSLRLSGRSGAPVAPVLRSLRH